MIFFFCLLCKMVFHDKVEWMSVGISMATSFAFWWVAWYFPGGDRYAPAIIGMTITGVRGAIAGADASGSLPDNLGVISATGYASGGQEGAGWNFTSAVVSALVTFVFWMFVGYFVISGSAWKYATAAAVVAAAGGLLKFG